MHQVERYDFDEFTGRVADRSESRWKSLSLLKGHSDVVRGFCEGMM